MDLVGWLWVIALPLWVLVGFYFNQPITEQFGAQVSDDWCRVPEESIGLHCFGDYKLPIQLISTGDAWRNQWSIPQPYSAVGLWPFLPSIWLSSLGVGNQHILIASILFFSICLLIPAIIAMYKTKYINKWVILITIGLVSTPSLIALDRGTTVALSVPLLTWGVLSFCKKRPNQLLIAIILLSLLRPQFVLFTLLFLPIKDYKRLFLAPIISGSLTIVSFWIWPGNPLVNLQQWINNLFTYTGYGSLTSEWPNNYSASRTVWRLVQLTGLEGQTEIFDLQIHAKEWINFPGLVLLIFVIFALWSIRNFQNIEMISVLIVLPLPMLVPGTSWGYYLTFCLPIAMLLIINSANNPLNEIKLGVLSPINIFIALSIVAVTLVPIPTVPNSPKDDLTFPPVYENGLLTPWIGGLWLALTILLSCQAIFATYFKKKAIIS